MSNAFYRRSAMYAAFFQPSDEMRGSIDREVRRLLGRTPRRVLDPACGPGLWLAHFAAKGAEVAGCDLEEDAIALASENLPTRGATVRVGDMRRPPDELGDGFDLVVNLDNSIGHLPEYMDVAEHLAAVRRRMSPRGVYLLGLAVREEGDRIEPGVVYERGPVDVPGGGFAALRTQTLGLQPVTRCERILQIAITAGVKDAPPVITEQYDLITFPLALLKDCLAVAGGFEVLACYDATDESLPERRLTKGAGDVLLALRPAQDKSQVKSRSTAQSTPKSAAKSAPQGKSARKPTREPSREPSRKSTRKPTRKPTRTRPAKR